MPFETQSTSFDALVDEKIVLFDWKRALVDGAIEISSFFSEYDCDARALFKYN